MSKDEGGLSKTKKSEGWKNGRWVSKGGTGQWQRVALSDEREQMSTSSMAAGYCFCPANSPRSKIDTSATRREGTCSIRDLIRLKDVTWEALRNASVKE